MNVSTTLIFTTISPGTSPVTFIRTLPFTSNLLFLTSISIVSLFENLNAKVFVVTLSPSGSLILSTRTLYFKCFELILANGTLVPKPLLTISSIIKCSDFILFIFKSNPISILTSYSPSEAVKAILSFLLNSYVSVVVSDLAFINTLFSVGTILIVSPMFNLLKIKRSFSFRLRLATLIRTMFAEV
ncbi:Uncharacterized protein MK1572 [Methanopyrus kandleri AV19]|uniref:Uncharacterized protein n=1 Tax=Methanopyrus kandleri (strain AV19 / DSM 6324 / JCM 9639 / NBRC 100938) TaxID=190192 RepID=Q8TV28_METKA|nr:Uncharacterized protein MK1572 [Methanopyrus kandleri AV19]